MLFSVFSSLYDTVQTHKHQTFWITFLRNSNMYSMLHSVKFFLFPISQYLCLFLILTFWPAWLAQCVQIFIWSITVTRRCTRLPLPLFSPFTARSTLIVPVTSPLPSASPPVPLPLKREFWRIVRAYFYYFLTVCDIVSTTIQLLLKSTILTIREI